jgi:nitrite reductase/ring-hydroxylating ferredoxin subunit
MRGKMDGYKAGENPVKDLECPKHHVGFVIETGEDMEETGA